MILKMETHWSEKRTTIFFLLIFIVGRHRNAVDLVQRFNFFINSISNDMKNNDKILSYVFITLQIDYQNKYFFLIKGVNPLIVRDKNTQWPTQIGP